MLVPFCCLCLGINDAPVLIEIANDSMPSIESVNSSMRLSGGRSSFELSNTSNSFKCTECLLTTLITSVSVKSLAKRNTRLSSCELSRYFPMIVSKYNGNRSVPISSRDDNRAMQTCVHHTLGSGLNRSKASELSSAYKSENHSSFLGFLH